MYALFVESGHNFTRTQGRAGPVAASEARSGQPTFNRQRVLPCKIWPRKKPCPSTEKVVRRFARVRR